MYNITNFIIPASVACRNLNGESKYRRCNLHYLLHR